MGGVGVGGGHCWPVLIEPGECHEHQPLRRGEEALSALILYRLSELFWSGAPWWMWRLSRVSEAALKSFPRISRILPLFPILDPAHQRDFWHYHWNTPSRSIPVHLCHCPPCRSHQHLLSKCCDHPPPRFHISTLAQQSVLSPTVRVVCLKTESDQVTPLLKILPCFLFSLPVKTKSDRGVSPRYSYDTKHPKF